MSILNRKSGYKDIYNGNNTYEEDSYSEIYPLFQNKSKIDSHNRTLADLYTGNQSGFNVKSALNKVIEINQRNDVKITVNYNEIETQDASQIGSLSSNFEDSKNYLIVYDYNSDGYIITMNISNI